LVANKVTWQQVGRVTEPGRYMFRFGWLTVTAEDLAVWQQFPNAAFTLVKTAATANSVAPANVVAPTDAVATTDVGEEFHLGAFELRENLPSSET
jgi:hypothetical protein